MAELSKYKSRVVFPKGLQRYFILTIQGKLDLDAGGLARILGVHRRTIADWKREKFLITIGALKKLCKRAGVTIPSNIKIQDQFWYTKKGAKKGWKALIKKYGRVPGDPEYRKEKWREWWEKTGKFNPSPKFRPLPFKQPKPSVELAEFMGIMMGDGGMSKTQVLITLHHIDDLAYSKFVIRLMNKLFGVLPAVYHFPKYSVNNIVISRSNLVQYLHSLGLPIGDKMRAGIDIPRWIKDNPKYHIPCIRGLVDTDGCVFIHKYKSNNKYYSYKKLAFTTASPALRDSVFILLKNLGMNPNVSQECDVRLNSKVDIKRYFSLIGSHNPKHLKKYKIVL